MTQTIYDAAGGEAAFLRLADAHHARCLADPVLEHPFSHGFREDHVERLARYLAEVFGGPTWYTDSAGGHSAMLDIHCGAEPGNDLGERFVACFAAAMDDAGLPADPALREAMLAYMRWAVSEVMAYGPADVSVPPNLALPLWSWSGPQPR